MQGIAHLHFVEGFCYTQLIDIELEINGLLTYDRRPKIEPERIMEINDRLFPRSRQNGTSKCNSASPNNKRLTINEMVSLLS
jgi:hypothetical protein